MLRGKQGSARKQESLAAWDRHVHLAIVLAAILPIVLGLSQASEDSGVTIAVNVVAWLVFVVGPRCPRQARPWLSEAGVGVFDLVIVILTAPWFLIPGLGGSQVLMVARLGRLARLLVASPGARKALQRLGRSASSPSGCCCSGRGSPIAAERGDQSRLRDVWRLAVVGHRHAHDRRLRRHRPAHREGPPRRRVPDAHGSGHARHPLGHHGQLLPHVRLVGVIEPARAK